MTISVAILGLGRIGHGFGKSKDGDPLSHSAAYKLFPEAKVVIAVDPDTSAQANFRRQFPDTPVHSSAQDVDAAMKIDLVSVCSPTEQHPADLALALRWGAKAILCEKPLAPTLAEARSMVQACEVAGCTLIVNYRRRWSPMFKALDGMTRPGGRIGQVLGASLRYDGGLMHNGTHYIDLLNGLFGPADDVSLVQAGEGASLDTSDSVMLTWRDGLSAHLQAVSGTGTVVSEGEIWGTDGIVRFSRAGRFVSWQAPVASEWKGFKEWGRQRIVCRTGLKGCIKNVVGEAISLAQSGGRPTCSGADCLKAMELVCRARGSEIK